MLKIYLFNTFTWIENECLRKITDLFILVVSTWFVVGCCCFWPGGVPSGWIDPTKTSISWKGSDMEGLLTSRRDVICFPKTELLKKRAFSRNEWSSGRDNLLSRWSDEETEIIEETDRLRMQRFVSDWYQWYSPRLRDDYRESLHSMDRIGIERYIRPRSLLPYKSEQ